MSILCYRLIVRFRETLTSSKKTLAPLGTKLPVHIKPEVRESWAPHATLAYYIGPALRHYRCYRVWITETNAEWILDTIVWFPHYTNLLIHTNQTTLLSALLELVEIFKNSIPVDAISPSPDGDDIANADDVIAENHLTPNLPIDDTLENIAPSPSSEIQITNDLSRVNIPSTNPASLPKVASPSTPCIHSHSLPRVVSPPTYADKAINPHIRRRKQRKNRVLVSHSLFKQLKQ